MTTPITVESRELHSPEPWRADDAYSPGCIVDRDGDPVCQGDDYAVSWDDHAPGNLRRVLACVNALQGVPTEALEAGALGKALDALAVLRTRVDMMAIDDATIALRALGRLP